MGAPVTSMIAGTILIAVFSRQLADEFKAWTPWLTQKLIAVSVRWLPLDQQERYQEEWSSHVDEIPGEIGKILVAFGTMWAAFRIRLLLHKATRDRTADNMSFRRQNMLMVYALFPETIRVNGIPLDQNIDSVIARDLGELELIQQCRVLRKTGPCFIEALRWMLQIFLIWDERVSRWTLANNSKRYPVEKSLTSRYANWVDRLCYWPSRLSRPITNVQELRDLQ
jgi:hypothetical protein